ncbi:MAG: GspE/PulE family protein [Gammaproteobacteria bacterium]|nr:type II/IV secretion system protein [Rhodocyclaceae bacterium]MBU3909843.1 GspE/PulE family protein [Gammaproteobacteria bacterium]MBU3988091.1 GspE/PulE family protein [Gammaproteobacteria bacterium]MBU4003578.1 GspE/PulE family protein [Gammaproteobacteria bacterium]MBU4020063.1 GspE/PulE family protein [Gammaproteobacteria bacterium]
MNAPAASAATKNAAEHRLTLPEIVDALIEAGKVPRAEAEIFRQERRYYRGDRHPLSVVAEQRWKSLEPPHRVLDIDALTEWLAVWSELDYYHIDPLKVNLTAVTDVMSSAYATRFRILPLEVRAEEVVIATAEPFLRSWVNELKPILKKEIRLVIANPEDIARYQVEFYTMARSVKGAMKRGDVARTGISNFEQLVELGKGKASLDANDQHVVMIVDWLWLYAFEQRASDIHIEPRRDMGVVRFRIDGVLHQVYQIPMPVLNAMTSRIKILGRMDVVEKRRPQDGRIKTRAPDGQEIELRLSTLPTAFGEKLVMRIFDPEVLVRDFADLGFSSEDAAHWQGMTSQPNGIILVTGPTGSGKTTTLYTTLKQLATQEVNVCTLEDPIEMVEPAFNQVQVQVELGLTFAAGIRTLMRQDPDIIMVGEIRDVETAEMAIQAALTGHLVLSTLHTNDAPTAITRLLDLGMPPYLLQSTVLGVMAQRLVRTLCPHCKTAGGLRAEDAALWQGLVAPWKSKKPTQLYHPVGCLECRMTGYQGRLGLYEIMPLTAELKSLISAHTDLAHFRERAIKSGMQPLRISGARKVAAGLTTIEEVLKVAPPLQDLARPQ